MSVQNANKLRKLFDRIPDSSLDKLRKKKIPFLSTLALSRMIQKKMPVRESSYEDYADFECEKLQEVQDGISKVEYLTEVLVVKTFLIWL